MGVFSDIGKFFKKIISPITDLFKIPDIPQLEAPKPIPVTKEDTAGDSAAAAKKKREDAARRKGYGSTILSGNLSPLGADQVKRPGASVLG